MSQAKGKRTVNVRRVIIFLIVVVLLILFVSGVLSITGVWDFILLRPLMNLLVLLSRCFHGSFGLAIIMLTIVVRLIAMPVTMRQLRSSKARQEIQPKIRELRKKYGKDMHKVNVEAMKLYKELGTHPLGCAFPILIQLPLWIALYQSVLQALAYTPENIVGLSKQLYSWSVIQDTVPLSHHFLWLDLTRGNIVMAVLVAASMWTLQKMSLLPRGDRPQESTMRIFMWILPLLFGYLCVTLPAGLSLYWVVANIIGIFLQYRVNGWGDLKIPSLSSVRSSLGRVGKSRQPVDTLATVEEASREEKKGVKFATKQRETGKGSVATEGKGVTGGDTSSQRNKGSPGEHTGERKN